MINAIGVGWVLRSIVARVKPTVQWIYMGNGTWQQKTYSTFKNFSIEFTIGKEFEEDLMDGRKSKVCQYYLAGFTNFSILGQTQSFLWHYFFCNIPTNFTTERGHNGRRQLLSSIIKTQEILNPSLSVNSAVIMVSTFRIGDVIATRTYKRLKN